MRYAELQVTTNFSFLRGASHPDEMVATAAGLELDAIAITDRNSLAGVVRAFAAAKRFNIRLVVGARLDLTDGASLLCFPTDRAAFGRLTRLLTLGKSRASKGKCHLGRADVIAHGEGQMLVVLPPPGGARLLDAAFAAEAAAWAQRFPGACSLAVHRPFGPDDASRLARLSELARVLPLVATNDVHYHAAARRPLQDVLTCIREHCTLEEAGWRLAANAERHLKPPEEMARLFKTMPEALERTMEIVERCRFSLDELRYEYPVDAEGDPQERLVRLTWEGAAWRYPGGIPDKVRQILERELALIGKKAYAPYFLTVHEIVRFAESKGILCQGRGSAANSAVCYVLGVTAVDPTLVDLLFERFVSVERNEPPDIDVDFEHERREEVIQHIYQKYGRERAGLAATVIHYRARSAIRDVGKAFGLSEDVIAALARTTWGWSAEPIAGARVREAGLDPTAPALAQALALAAELTGFPRHLSQHVGGFVITKGRLDEVVPIEKAAMKDRTVIEWDKDDLDQLGMLKIDVLALGMLTCIRKAFDLLRDHRVGNWTLATVPGADPAVYEMLSRADSIGVFQVESRAQMTMLPRLRPACFYDLVIEVAIVRPGPIQGGMVHPYLRRREGKEEAEFPSEKLKEVLGKTLGVPLFQEQAMRIAMVAGGFSAAEADQLRRAMAAFRRTGEVSTFRDKLIRGMVGNGYTQDFAERVFRQIEGFGEYGFPESHAASFALLVYVSAWIKWHHPAVFACALLNSQPMGFYAPAQLVRDAADHGVEVRPVDVNASAWDCTLEPTPEPTPAGTLALRLGFRQIEGFAARDAKALVEARHDGYESPEALWRRARLGSGALTTLAQADAFGSMSLSRREALWAVCALTAPPPPLFAAAPATDTTTTTTTTEPAVTLPKMTLGEEVVEDYAALKLSLKIHPVALLRRGLQQRGIIPAARLRQIDQQGRRLKVAGLVLVRQRPGTASGVIFITLEDETGIANIVVWPKVFDTNRRIILTAGLLGVEGRLQKENEVIHIIADRVEDLTSQLRTLGNPPPKAGTKQGGIGHRSRDFH